MKSTIVAFVLVLLMCNRGIRLSSHDNERYKFPIYINERVGDQIDSIEREEYRLFPNIDGFISAALYEHPLGWKWEIITEKERLVVVNKDSAAVLILADYIERYEEIVGSDFDFENKWNIVDYDVLGQPITQNELDYVTERLEKQKNARTMAAAAGGCLSGACIGCVVGYNVRDTEHIYAVEEAWLNLADVPEVAIGIGAGVGAVLGFGLAVLTIKADAEEAMYIVKKGREPVIVE
ncbi:MAG: hypothetical protein JSV98_10400 [candidate division WOR-3 bacterium]|nr:MAG: hypothetical protein JSV98_10400 [candidate division WOR-3 bacterium]